MSSLPLSINVNDYLTFRNRWPVVCGAGRGWIQRHAGWTLERQAAGGDHVRIFGLHAQPGACLGGVRGVRKHRVRLTGERPGSILR